MSGDLVSLRMLVIAAGQAEQELWRRGAGMASVPIDFLAQDPTSATETLARGGTDICVLDEDLPEAYKAGIVQASRLAKPAPLVFVSSSAPSRRPEGVNGMLARPQNTEQARRVAEICIRTKIPTRVMIVDDSSTMRMIVRKILAGSRFALDVHEKEEGIGALNELRSGRFGLVFLDYNMPGLNGIETLSEIKRENPNVAVVMITSAAEPAVADRAYAAGALAFLRKPFYPADIDAVLERYYCVHLPTIGV